MQVCFGGSLYEINSFLVWLPYFLLLMNSLFELQGLPCVTPFCLGHAGHIFHLQDFAPPLIPTRSVTSLWVNPHFHLTALITFALTCISSP